MGKRYRKRFNKHNKKPYHKNKFLKKTDNESPVGNHNIEKEDDIVQNKDSLKEHQVGITEYINRGEGFKGIIKSRFSDFHVNEIDIGGKILHLTDLTIPEEKEEELTPEEISSARLLLKDIVSEDMWNQINDLKEAKLEKHKKPKDHYIDFDVSAMNKEQRTKFHKVIGTLHKNKLVSRTVWETEPEYKSSEKKIVRVMKSNGPGRNTWNFPGEIVYFLVYKENLDTSDVASAIASKLRLKPSQVNYCGTKDKRAKTTQRFCIKKRSPSQIAGTVKFMNGVTLGNFEFRKKYIKLGDLRGNRFRIALRNLVGEREHIETSLKNVKDQGFINYFGFQRFGNCSSIPTYEVGIALLKANYKLACELILKPRDNDVPFLKEIREMWWKNRDSKAAAAQFYSDRFIEKKLLDGLAQYGEKDYAAALMRIPRNMLLLYPHAFQSLIFNFVASKRIKEFGLTVLPGDLVYIHKEELLEEFEAEQKQHGDKYVGYEGNQEGEKDVEDQDEEREFVDLSDQEEFIDEKDAVPKNPAPTKKHDRVKFRFKRQVKFLTEEEITGGKYNIHDVLLTIPGHDVSYPDNVVGSFYKEFMEKYDLSSENFKHSIKMFSMKGAYRKLVVQPRDMSWEFKSYSAPDETLILSDLEVLQGKTIEDFKTVETEPKYEALLLDFCLPPAAYATMMLRELLKCDTSAAAQSILQKEANKEHTDVRDGEKDTSEIDDLCVKREPDDNENEGAIIDGVETAKSVAVCVRREADDNENEGSNHGEIYTAESVSLYVKREADDNGNEGSNHGEIYTAESVSLYVKREADDNENDGANSGEVYTAESVALSVKREAEDNGNEDANIGEEFSSKSQVLWGRRKADDSDNAAQYAQPAKLIKEQ